MDGVIYKGAESIAGAVEFINGLKKRVPFLFLTNNSQRTSRDVCYKLLKMGFNVIYEDIFTCAMATARYLASKLRGEQHMLLAKADSRLNCNEELFEKVIEKHSEKELMFS